MLSLSKNVPKQRKFNRSKLKKTNSSVSLHRILITKRVTVGVIGSCSEFYNKHRHQFMETFRDEIQFGNNFNADMHRNVNEILRRITVASGDPSIVVDSDNYKSSESSNSVDSGQSSLSNFEETSEADNQESEENAIVVPKENAIFVPEENAIVEPEENDLIVNQPNDEPVIHEQINYAAYANTESFRINFAYHAKRILEKKFLLLDINLSCLFAAELAIAARFDDGQIKNLELDTMVAFLRHGPI